MCHNEIMVLFFRTNGFLAHIFDRVLKALNFEEMNLKLK